MSQADHKTNTTA